MSKAKSRLKPKPTQESKEKSKSTFNAKIFSRRARYYPTLALGILFGIVFGYIIISIPPDQIRNSLLPGSYLPLVGSFFLMLGFILSYLLLNSRRGFTLAAFLSSLLAFRVQQVALTWSLIGTTLLLFLIFWLIWEFSLTLKRRR